MQAHGNFGLKTRGFLRGILMATVVCWLLAFLVFAFAGTSWLKVPAVVGAYWTAAVFAGIAVVGAALGADNFERAFWLLLGGGLLLRVAGYVGWTRSLDRPDTATLALHDVAHVASYILLIGALLWLVTRIARTATPLARLNALLTAFDALFVIVSVGSLVWYFLLDPVAGEAGIDTAREVFSVLRRPAGDAGLLFLSLAVLSATRRPPYASLLTLAFGVSLCADAVYLRLRSAGPYEIGNWPEALWALGIVLLGLAALRSHYSIRMRSLRIQPRSVFLFWCGPLSPAVHFGVLFAWTLSEPPVPDYVMLGGMVLLLYMAFRISVLSHIDHRLAEEKEEAAKRAEQSRIAEELHDTLKQTVHSIPVMLRTYREVRKSGEANAAEEILNRALETSREASYRISRPVWELRNTGDLDSMMLIDQMLRDIEKGFAIEVHRETEVSLGGLNQEELAAAYRIVSEALWNGAKHAGAKNVWFETRKEPHSILVRVRDDGRGFLTDSLPSGLGLPLMRKRAEAAGANLDIISRPGEGTTVRVRFEKK